MIESIGHVRRQCFYCYVYTRPIDNTRIHRPSREICENVSSECYSAQHMMYGSANGNARLAARLYADRFLNRHYKNWLMYL